MNSVKYNVANIATIHNRESQFSLSMCLPLLGKELDNELFIVKNLI